MSAQERTGEPLTVWLARETDLDDIEEMINAFAKGHPTENQLRSGNAGDLNGAERLYREAAQLRPNEPDPYMFLGAFFERNGQVNRAIDAYDIAVGLAADEPGLIVELQRRLGTLRAGSRSV